MVEIQIHPSDIRKRVRYHFLDHRRLLFAAAILVAVVGLELVGLVTAPVVGLRWREQRLRSRSLSELVARERVLEGTIEEIGTLRERTEADRLLLVKLSQMYGLPGATGIGGYPSTSKEPAAGADGPARAAWLVSQSEGGLAAASKILEELLAYEEEHRTLVRVTPSLSPLPSDEFVLTSGFGHRVSPFTKRREFHNGLDMAIAEGTAVTAPAEATVAFAGRFKLSASVNWWRYGNCVVLDHDGYFQTIYAHLAEVDVRTGQRVRQGTVLGKVGSTGWSTAPHLHYEIRIRQNEAGAGFLPVDPRVYVLNCRWNDEAKLLSRRRISPSAEEFDPLPLSSR